MKKFKLLSSIAAVTAISCVAAASSMAADAIEFKTNVAKSTATTKVIDVYYTGTSLAKVSSCILRFSGITNNTANATSSLPNFSEKDDRGYYTLSSTTDAETFVPVENGSALLATITVANSDAINLGLAPKQSLAGKPSGSEENVSLSEKNMDITDKLAVVNAADLGTFTDGEGVPAKAYKATLTGEGAITWYVTDGKGHVADKALTEFTGGAGVVIGLVATGDNVADINYATVTID